MTHPENVVPNAITVPKKGGGDAIDTGGDGESTFQKYKTYIFGVTTFLLLALVILLISCCCKKKKEGTTHGIFSDYDVSFGKRYIN